MLAVVSGCFVAEAAEHLLYRSEDGGGSWSRSDSGLPGDARINALTASEGTMLAGTDAGIFISEDSGKRWKKSEIAGTKSVRVVALASVEGRCFAASDRTLLVSTNGGRNWVPSESFPRKVIRCLFSHQGIVYAGMDVDGVYRSKDLGGTWTQVADGLPAGSQVLAFTAVEEHVFAGLYAKGIFKLEPGERWTQMGADEGIKPLVLTSVGGTMIAGHNPGGIYASDDLGRSWRRWQGENRFQEIATPLNGVFGQFGVSLEAPVWEMGASGRMVFAGVADGIFYSADLGRSWTRATKGLPAVSPGVAFLVSNNVVLAATLANHRTR